MLNRLLHDYFSTLRAPVAAASIPALKKVWPSLAGRPSTVECCRNGLIPGEETSCTHRCNLTREVANHCMNLTPKRGALWMGTATLAWCRSN